MVQFYAHFKSKNRCCVDLFLWIMLGDLYFHFLKAIFIQHNKIPNMNFLLDNIFMYEFPIC